MPHIKPFPTLAAFLAILLLLAAYSVHAATPAESGKRIYREGRLPSGEPLRGRVSNGVVLSGEAAACATCHRRSGLGGGEGRNTVRPIAGRLLFDSPQDKPAPGLFAPYVAAEDRPAYTQATLVRALREGVNPAGRTLDALMPRYALSGKEVGQLAAYLKQLAPLSVPGVTASDIHFATVVAPDVPPEQEEAMLAVLRAFFSDKNGGTRQERRRREVGRSVVGSEQMYRGYRNWQLHVWRLEGAPESWPVQLESHYRQQPVFALLSGIGAGDWQPMHEFCERNEIPCLFPNADFPPDDAEGYSSFYFSRGLALEAEVLAKHLYDEEQDGAIVQVYRDDAGGRASAQALRAAMLRNGFDTLVDRELDDDRPVPEASWIQLINDERPNTLILWLDDADIAEFPVELGAPPWLNGLYVSGSLVPQTGSSRLAEGWRDKIRIVYPFELKEHMAQRLLRMEAWLRIRNIAPADTRIQANAFFAATIAGDALAHMDENFSRDYFIERVEHMTEQSLFPSVYPRLSLGPGQRFASRGGYVAGYTQDGGQRIVPLSDWIVP